ncbi:MAG: MBL fold metallo-hydrolase [Pseudomonadota bacterium]
MHQLNASRLLRLSTALTALILSVHLKAADVTLPDTLEAQPEAFEFDLPLGSATPWQPDMDVFVINPNLLVFCDGRQLDDEPDWVKAPASWTGFDAGLGTCVYVIHDAGDALVLDSLWTRSQGDYIRNHMQAQYATERFTLVLTHWHLDHIGGNAAFADSRIISGQRTADVLEGYADHIRAGTLWGPPAMPDLVLPNVTFNDRLELTIGSIPVAVSHYNVHSDDHIFVYLPEQKIGLVGDMTEDTVPVISHPEQIPQHLAGLKSLRQVDMAVLYPNHGNPDVIKSGGYDKSAIDATAEYQRNMLLRSHDDDFLQQPMESFIPVALKNKAVTVHEYYRVAHEFSRGNVAEYWAERPLPAID